MLTVSGTFIKAMVLDRTSATVVRCSFGADWSAIDSFGDGTLMSGGGEPEEREIAGLMMVVACRLAMLSVEGVTLRTRDLKRVKCISRAFVAASC